MEELKIKVIPSELKPRDKRLDSLRYKGLPAHPANIMLLGRAGAGKSSCLHTMLNEGYVPKGAKWSIFDEAIVYLGSMDSAETFKKLPIKNLIVLHEFVPEEFQEYLEDLKAHQMDRLDKGKHPLNVAIIFDDFAGQNLLKKVGNASPLERLLLTSRHECNATVMYCSQTYKNNGFSNPTIRNNTTHYIIYPLARNDVEKVAEEHCNHMTPEQFVDVYNHIHKQPHQFMMINYRKPDAERFTHGFNKVISTKLKDDVSHNRHEDGVESELERTGARKGK